VSAIDDPAIDTREAGTLRARREASGRAGRAGRILLTVGRLAPQKRIDLMIRAFHRGARADDRLVVLGDGPRRKRLIRLVADLGLTGRVALIGHCEDVGEWLARADLFVLASDYEGLPAVLVEAMTAEIPILSTISSPGVANLLGEGRLGRLVPPGDETALAAAIGAEPPPLDRGGMRRQVARFTLDRAAPAYLRIFRKIVDAGADIADGERLNPVDNQRGSHRVSH
jgi:glycosyltransferase involved in cell wall biosynthesis